MPYQPRATFDNPYGPQVQFRTLDVLPPAAYYVGLDDQIVWNVYASYAPAVYYLVVRMLNPQGLVAVETRQLTNFSAGFQKLSTSLTGMEGYLLSAAVSAPGVPLSAAYVTVTLMRAPSISSGIVTGLLASGYAADTQLVSYPAMIPQGPLDGPAQLTTFNATPAAGADWTFVCPAQTRWQVVTGRFQLATSAAAGTREVSVVVTDKNVNQLAVFPAAPQQPASSSYVYSLSPGGAAATTANFYTIPISNRVILEDSASIGSYTVGLQPGDQYSGVVIQVEEWVGV